MYLQGALRERRANLSLLRFSAAVLVVLVFSVISLLAQDIIGTSTSANDYKPKITAAKRAAPKPKQTVVAKAKTPVKRKTPVRTKQPEADDTATENYYELGQKCAKEDYDCQIENYTKSIEANEDDDASHYYRGFAYSRTGQLEESLADFTKVIGINPTEPNSYYQRGYVYRKMKDYDLAVKDFIKLSELTPDKAQPYTELAETYIIKENFPEALKYYDLAIARDATDSTQFRNRGYVYYRLGNNEEAFKNYDKAVQVNPNDATAYGNRGNSYFRMGKYEAALQDHNKAIEINPKNPDFFSNRADDYRKLNLTSLADADTKKAAELKGGSTASAPLTGAAAELRDIISQFASAFFAGDKTKIEQTLSREFTWRRISGELLSRQQVVGMTATNEQFLSHSINDFKILIESTDSTVVSYNESTTLKNGTITRDRVTAALAKREGRWQIVSLTFYSQ